MKDRISPLDIVVEKSLVSKKMSIMEKSVTHDFVSSMPKCELHVHIEGTLEPELKLKLARRNNIQIGQHTIEEVKSTYLFSDLASFLAVYYPALNVLQTEQDFYDLAIEYLHKAAVNNVRHAEIFFDPQAHTSRGIDFATVINGLHRAVVDGRALNVDSALILCFLRDMSEESAQKTLIEALSHKDKLIGVGLDSNEQNNPPLKFLRQFRDASAAGLRITVHCDIDQENSIQHIRQALESLRAERIDHGTNILESNELVDFVKKKGLGLTTCPLSNSFVSPTMKSDEILELLRKGVKVSINSDDPAYFNSYISDNYYAIAQKMGLSRDDIVKFAVNSFETSWISEEKRKKFLREIEEYAAKH